MRTAKVMPCLCFLFLEFWAVSDFRRHYIAFSCANNGSAGSASMLKMFRCVKMHAFFFAEKSVIEKKWIKLPSFVSRSIKFIYTEPAYVLSQGGWHCTNCENKERGNYYHLKISSPDCLIIYFHCQNYFHFQEISLHMPWHFSKQTIFYIQWQGG